MTDEALQSARIRILMHIGTHTIVTVGLWQLSGNNRKGEKFVILSATSGAANFGTFHIDAARRITERGFYEVILEEC